MRILVTGASGFIGSTLVPALAASGHEVVSAPREPVLLAEAMAGCDSVVHLANLAHVIADRALLWKVNVDGTRQVARTAAAQGVRRLIYLSSIKASGEETTGRPFDASEIEMPEDDYGRAKLAAEQVLFDVGVEAVVLRPPLVYGPGVKGNFLALMRAVAGGWPLPLANIANRRSLVYVGNLVDAILRCLAAGSAARRVYTVSDGAPVSTTELCVALGEALEKPARLFSLPTPLLELLPGGKRLTRSLELDDRAIRGDLGWQPPFSFHEGLRAAARWYQGR
jgi:nucleoside-diphosphate-sugar epimerase